MEEIAKEENRTETSGVTIETIGNHVSEFQVEISTRFLKHFSEQLYSSPQKAFEELISNGWDAGASVVDVRISSDLSDPTAALCILDNGASMDEEGLRKLWHIAFSEKTENQTQFGRPVIGKYGIGKLATYVLANKLTYICCASDGIIRRVTMDYQKLDGDGEDTLINQLPLEVYEVELEDVKHALQGISGGEEVFKIIETKFPYPVYKEGEEWFDEFKGASTPQQGVDESTWTLAILTGLKPLGQEIKSGILRRMLRAALPFGSQMAITLNGERLSSAKVEWPLIKEWVVGPDLKLKEIKIYTEVEDDDSGEEKPLEEVIPISSGTDPVPYISIPGIGKITGSIRLFKDEISGGKSEVLGTSNGFYVNVLGRVVNQADVTFGEKNLSHSAWARYRLAVRADGLGKFQIINREGFHDTKEMKIFRAFLRQAFNKARSAYDDDNQASLTDGGDVLVKSLGVVSLNPLRSIVSKSLRDGESIQGLVDIDGVGDKAEALTAWQADTADNIRESLGEVKFETFEDHQFVKYRATDRAVIINNNHPFYLEHSRTKAEKELVRTVGLLNLLTDFYSLEAGVARPVLASIRDYRDKVMRLKALERRSSGVHIAQLLLDTQRDPDSNKLEVAVSDAFEYLGFDVERMAKSGTPEGVASAFAFPSGITSADVDRAPIYRFTYDAKSTSHDKVATNNINLAALVDHRKQHDADYTFVVGPEFTAGKEDVLLALDRQCEEQKVTPIRASDLGRLLKITVKFGAIPLTLFREIFSFYRIDEVSEWIDDVSGRIEKQRKLTIDLFVRAVHEIRGQVPSALPPETIALVCLQNLEVPGVTAGDVLDVARGLAVLIPELVGIDGGKIVVNASPKRIADAIARQYEQLQIEEEEVKEEQVEKGQ